MRFIKLAIRQLPDGKFMKLGGTMKTKNIFLIILILLIIGEIYFYFDHEQNPLERKRIRKPYKAFVERPFGTPLKKEPDAVTNEWMAYQRCYPYNEIKLDSYLSGMEQAQFLHENSPNLRYEWELVGPTNIGGRITDLTIHPDSPEKEILKRYNWKMKELGFNEIEEDSGLSA